LKTPALCSYSVVLAVMKKLVKKNRWLLFFLTCIFPVFSFSQSVTGIWKGYFISETGENYRLEFQVKQNTSYSVSGVSYSYLDIRFYGKATMTGSFVKSSNNFRIREIRTVEVKSSTYGGTCIMNYDLQYSKSGKEEFLEGTYLGKQEVKDKENPFEWGQCGGGKVFLRKVSTSDFYVEPFLRKNTTTNKPVIKNTPTPDKTIPAKPLTPPPTKSTTTKPVTTKPVAAKPRAVVPKPSTGTKTNQVTIKKQEIQPKADSLKTKDVRNQGIVKAPVITPSVLRNRQNELMKSLIVNNPDVTIKLYDNGEIDDDSISVYLDKKLVLFNKRLTASPLVINLKMDEENPDHELVMVAENLGRIPPNTSLMIVEAGNQRFDVRITSTEQKNAVVRFKYQKP
jgi:hypothetical protein